MVHQLGHLPLCPILCSRRKRESKSELWRHCPIWKWALVNLFEYILLVYLLMLTNNSLQALFSTPEECCTAKVPWVATSVCVAESVPPFEVSGTGKWYASYEYSKCLQDCPVGNSSACGGVIHESHITLFDDPGSCCSQRLFWIPREECIA